MSNALETDIVDHPTKGKKPLVAMLAHDDSVCRATNLF